MSLLQGQNDCDIFKLFLRFVLNYVYKYLACIYGCSLCALGTCRGQENVLEPLELELKMTLSQHADAGN